jgi:MarR family transcriptional regulator for hemolysin
MAQLLTRMEREGLIERTPDPKDGRSSLINLTPHALKKAKPARDVLSEGSQVALKGFSPSEIRALNRLLLRVRSNLEEAIDE